MHFLFVIFNIVFLYIGIDESSDFGNSINLYYIIVRSLTALSGCCSNLNSIDSIIHYVVLCTYVLQVHMQNINKYCMYDKYTYVWMYVLHQVDRIMSLWILNYRSNCKVEYKNIVRRVPTNICYISVCVFHRHSRYIYLPTYIIFLYYIVQVMYIPLKCFTYFQIMFSCSN